MLYTIVRRPTRKNGPALNTITTVNAKSGNAALRENGYNAPKGKSVYQNQRGAKRGYEFAAKPVKG